MDPRGTNGSWKRTGAGAPLKSMTQRLETALLCSAVLAVAGALAVTSLGSGIAALFH